MADPKTIPFMEICPPEISAERTPSLVQAYVAAVNPKECGPLIKRLSKALPLTHETLDLSHLKRVKRTPLVRDPDVDHAATDNEDTVNSDAQQSSRKRQKTTGDSVRLEVFLGAVSHVDERIQQEGDAQGSVGKLLSELQVYKVEVPARLPDSEKEWKNFNSQWPTAFFPNKTREFREKALELSQEEIHQMNKGMCEAISDILSSNRAGVVVFSPVTGMVVARASEERNVQGVAIDERNPLVTSVLLALQGVSRLERSVAIEKGMESDSFQKGQYLCTGYDVYTTLEPTVFEAMALVHARVRRVVFGCASSSQVGGLLGLTVHALPGTNHHYRAFQCGPGSDLWQQCHSHHVELLSRV